MENKNLTRKIEKKQRKHQHVVNKETRAECTQSPTKNIAICNSGQVNGLSEDDLLESFAKFGPIEQIVLPPGKSCCFLSFKHVTSSIEAMQNCNGLLNIAQNSKPVFLSYVSSLPNVEIRKQFAFPPGLVVLEEFITEEEENLLFSLSTFVDNDEFDTMKYRQVKHYGYEFLYDINNVDKTKPLKEQIPKQCFFLWERLRSRNNINFTPDQLTVNYYKPGQGIPSHIDTHSAFEDPIVSLSLASLIVMEFRKDLSEHYCVVLPRRSLAIMSGESRYYWTHGITPRKFDFYPSNNGCYNTIQRGARISFTFRKILQTECRCNYKTKCDSVRSYNDIENNLAAELENKHVHDVYKNIATHFSDTRHKPWPNVLNFIQSFNVGDILIDVGCGNGKYLGLNPNIYIFGCDTSTGLLNVCKEKEFESFSGNCLNIPLKRESVDGVICIAVIHHLANEERRLQAIREIINVLKTGGNALIYVWAKDQHKNNEKTNYIKQNRKNRTCIGQSTSKENDLYTTNGVTLPIHTNRTQFNHNDLFVPWKLKGDCEKENTFLRFYHVFEEEELENLCKKLPNIQIIKSYYDQGNWCVILNKI